MRVDNPSVFCLDTREARSRRRVAFTFVGRDVLDAPFCPLIRHGYRRATFPTKGKARMSRGKVAFTL